MPSAPPKKLQSGKPWRGWHICGSAYAWLYPWCVPRNWTRDETCVTFKVDLNTVDSGGKEVYDTKRVCTEHLRPPKPPQGYWRRYWLTAYSACDTPGGVMADGTPVWSPAGQHGAGATPPGWLGGLPFGTRILVPTLHRVVTIHDRGDPGNYFVNGLPHIDVYSGWDCSLFGNFLGKGSHAERVFVYGR